MTYKSSYFKLSVEDMRRRLLLIIVTAVAFFGNIGTFFLEYIVTMTGISDIARDEALQHMSVICMPDTGMCLLAMLLGVFYAAQGFAHLHSKQKMDYYGSLPISRSRRFAVICSNQAIIYTLPLLLLYLAKNVLVMVSGYGSKEAYIYLCAGMLYMLVCFLAAWTITIFMVCITGHLVISFACVLLVGVYVPAWVLLYEGACSAFLDTYVGAETADVFNVFSPFMTMSKMVPGYEEKWSLTGHGIWSIVMLAYAVVFFFLAYRAFLKRPNEATNRAMAFPKWNRVIQIAIVIPCALIFGMFWGSILGSLGLVFAIPTVIISGVVAHLLVELIFSYNIRKVFRHIWQMVGSVAFAVLLLVLAAADITGHDSYFPEAEEIRAVYVNTYGGEDAFSYEDIDPDTEMSGELKETILTFVEPLMHATSAEVLDDAKNIFSKQTVQTSDVYVAYVTKDGKIKQRNYVIPYDTNLDGKKSYYQMEEYRQLLWGVIEKKIPYLTSVTWSDIVNSAPLTMTEEQTQEFWKIYKEEYCSGEESGKSLGQLEIAYYYNGNYETYSYYVLYESYEKTRAFLESIGITFPDYDQWKITKLAIDKYETVGWDVEYLYEEITDQKLIESYRDQMVIEYVLSKEAAEGYSVMATLESPDGSQVTDHYIGLPEKAIEELLATKK